MLLGFSQPFKYKVNKDLASGSVRTFLARMEKVVKVKCGDLLARTKTPLVGIYKALIGNLDHFA